jgi:excisionase family DNA binding protein
MARERVTRQYISQAEAGELLGVTERTIRTAIADGRLKGYALGRTVRLRLDEVHAALVPIGAAAADAGPRVRAKAHQRVTARRDPTGNRAAANVDREARKAGAA